MFDVNEYFDGKVKSIAFHNGNDKATIGVMAVGDYEFSTSSSEYMTLVSGKMAVKLPDEEDWRDIAVNETFVIAADKSFLVNIKEEASYLCTYK